MTLEQTKAQDIILKKLNDADHNTLWDISELHRDLSIQYDLCYVACEEMYDRDHIDINTDRPISSEKYANDKMVNILSAGSVYINNGYTYEAEFLSDIAEYENIKRQKEEGTEKLILETRLAKLQLKVFWPLVITAILGGVTGLIALLAQVGYIDLPQQKESQIKQIRDTTLTSPPPKTED